MQIYLIVVTGKSTSRFYVNAPSYKKAVEIAADTIIEDVPSIFHEVTDPNLDPVCHFAIQDENGMQRNVFFIFINSDETTSHYSLKTFLRVTDAVYLKKKFTPNVRREA